MLKDGWIITDQGIEACSAIPANLVLLGLAIMGALLLLGSFAIGPDRNDG